MHMKRFTPALPSSILVDSLRIMAQVDFPDWLKASGETLARPVPTFINLNVELILHDIMGS